MLDVASTSRDVVLLDGVDHLGERQAVGDELHRIGLDVVLLDVPADRLYTRDILHALELRADNPVLNFTEIGRQFQIASERASFGCQVHALTLPAGLARRKGGSRAVRLHILNGVHVDLAQPRGNRSHDRFDSRRERFLGFAEAFADLLSGKVDVDIVLEDGGDLREAVPRERTRRLKAGNAGQCVLDGERHLFLDLDGREAGRDGVDLHLVVGDVGHRVDRKPLERVHAQRPDHHGQQQHKPAVLDGEMKDGFKHGRGSLMRCG